MRIFKLPMYFFQKRQIDVHAYNIIVYYNNKAQFCFKISLQPSDVADELPFFQLSKKSEVIPDLIKNEMSIISKWVSDNHTYDIK